MTTKEELYLELIGGNGLDTSLVSGMQTGIKHEMKATA